MSADTCKAGDVDKHVLAEDDIDLRGGLIHLALFAVQGDVPDPVVDVVSAQ